MLPDDRIYAHAVAPLGGTVPIPKVSVAGEEVRIWRWADIVESAAQSDGTNGSGSLRGSVPEFARRTAQGLAPARPRCS
jgi:hypothetical protein